MRRQCIINEEDLKEYEEKVSARKRLLEIFTFVVMNENLTTNEPDKTAVTSGFDSLILSGGFVGYSGVSQVAVIRVWRKKSPAIFRKIGE